MSDSDDKFDPLDATLGAMRHGLGPCPDAAALAGFAAQTLPSDEATRVQAHVSMCGICDSLVESLKHFDDPLSALPDWASTERRLRVKVFPRQRRWSWLLHPAVAYGVALAAVTVAFVPVRHKAFPTPVSPAPAQPTIVAPGTTELQSLRTIDLNTTRGARVPHFALGSGDRLVLLSFLIDVHPGFHYEASLDGRTAQSVTSSDGKGNFAVLVNRELLGPGSHDLKVAEIEPASGKSERSFDFSFQL
jgi:hypothetical protein